MIHPNTLTEISLYLQDIAKSLYDCNTIPVGSGPVLCEHAQAEIDKINDWVADIEEAILVSNFKG